MPNTDRPTSAGLLEAPPSADQKPSDPPMATVQAPERQTSEQCPADYRMAKQHASAQQALARHVVERHVVEQQVATSPHGSVSPVDEWAAALWQFSLQHYPKWQTTLLTWQDRDGLPINLVLFLIFAKQHELDISLAAMQQQWCYVQRSQQQLLHPLRQLRRQLPLLPDIQTGGDALKQALLKAELVAEQAEQRALIQIWLEHHMDSPCRAPYLASAQNTTHNTSHNTSHNSTHGTAYDAVHDAAHTITHTTATAIPITSSAQDALHIHLAALAGYSPYAWHQLLLDLDQIPLNRGG